MFPLFQKYWLGFCFEKYQGGKCPSVSNGYLHFAEASVVLRAAGTCVTGENADIRIRG